MVTCRCSLCMNFESLVNFTHYQYQRVFLMYELWSGKGVSLGLQLLRICFLSCNPQFGSSKIPFCISYLDSSLEFFLFFFHWSFVDKEKAKLYNLGEQFGKIYQKARVGTSTCPPAQDPAKKPQPRNAQHTLCGSPVQRDRIRCGPEDRQRGWGGSARTDSGPPWVVPTVFSFPFCSWEHALLSLQVH